MNIRDLYRGINENKNGYQSGTNINTVKDENGDLLVDTHRILNRWKNYFSQLLSVCRVSVVKQAGPLVLDRSPFEVEIAIA
jgi:hypothetical protein